MTDRPQDSSSALEAISPIDGRYAGRCRELAAYFSEAALIRYRVRVEAAWFLFLAEDLRLDELAAVGAPVLEVARALVRAAPAGEAAAVKAEESRINHDVKAAMAALKPMIALYVGGMGAKQMNFHKDNMVNRGFGEAADRIQELFLAKKKDEAIAAVPDEFVDQGALIGPPERIRERWKLWADSGLTHIKIANANDEAMELMARIAL